MEQGVARWSRGCTVEQGVHGGAGGTNDSRHGESVLARAYYAPKWVAEHLGASSRRPRHPFPALMAGEPLAVYLCTRPKKDKPD